MRDPFHTGHAERLAAAADAKKALLSKMKPKPTVTAAVLESRAERREKELAEVRAARAQAKAADERRIAAREAAQLEAKRAERRDRKAAFKAEQRAKREAKSAMRKVGRA
jgi:hypothetical protein